MRALTIEDWIVKVMLSFEAVFPPIIQIVDEFRIILHTHTVTGELRVYGD